MKNIKRELFEKLKKISNDKDFVVGVISNAGTYENYQELINFIDRGENVTVENLIALSILLDDSTEKQKPQ